jgi:gliding motility-associated-like protein
MTLFLRTRILIITWIALLLSPAAGYASHSMGADLTYTCMGGNTYKITVSFYRDCVGITAPASPFVTISSPSCGLSTGVTCYPRPGTGQEVTPTCSSAVTTCNGGYFTGIQEWIYDGIITLPMQCTDWTFGYSLCCRNGAITTINTPSTNTFYIYATLNNTITPCNSSPTFSNKPVPFLCLGQQFCFNHGAYDLDGDSLVYQLITPKQTATTTVNYQSPYTASNPLNSSPATTFSTSTGDICLTPQAMEVTVMAVLVKEYRNGILIGSVERDLQLTVRNCANTLPSLTGINGTNVFDITVCANQNTCFNIFSNDPDSGQQLTVTWNGGIPAANFNTGSGLNPSGNFCWTPGTANIGGSYTFTASVEDDACPYNGSQTYSYTINVTGINVSAGPDQPIACGNLSTLTAAASGGSGSYTYLWSNGSTSNTISAGVGTYWVTASDGNCSATDTVNVITPNIPVAAFTAPAVNCSNSPISFTDQSSSAGGTIANWWWDFGDGSTSTSQTPAHQFPGAGTYTISLIVENTQGCRDTATMQITIASPPVAEFSASSACLNSAVAFTDLSTGTTVSWNWDFGDGTNSTTQNPSHNFTSAGSFPVTLVSTNASGCVDTISHVIIIYNLPSVNAGSDVSVCAGGSVTLTSSGALTYSWIPGGSGSTITINPSGSTNIIVTGTDANGCISTDTVNVSVNPLPVINAGTDQFVCSGGSVTLTATGAGNYSWTPGNLNGSIITVNPAATTNYTVTGTDANGCSASDIISVTEGALPVASAGPDVDMCDGAQANLSANGGISYLWSPTGSTNQNITVSPPVSTNYTVIVTDANGCTAADDITINIHSAPVVNLQSFFLCAGAVATLNAGNPGSSFLWNTGETTQSIQINNGGNYTVTVTNSYGCTTIASCNITPGNNLTINLGNVSFCQGDSVVLDAGYPGNTYSWSPGGQTTQTITVNAAGTYGVVVTDQTGCSGSINVTAVVNQFPVSSFSATSVCSGLPTIFTDASSVIAGNIISWSWDFGDGGSSQLQHPSHLFASAGNYSVTLVTTSNNGCTSSTTSSVTVNPLPVADFTFANVCAGSPLNFTDISLVTSGNITGYLWDFGDGSGSALQNPTHSFNTAGNYNVSLTVTTAGGCTSTINQTIVIHPLPLAAFSATTVCLGDPTILTNNSSIPTGSIATSSWDFNDTYTSNQTSPTHTFLTAGSQTVDLTVTSNFGCTSTFSQTVTVNALPVANAGADQVICVNSTVTLTATGGVSYIWNPGGITSSALTVSPVANSSYTVNVTGANGCTSADVVNVNVNSLPIANAGGDQSVCSGSSLTLSGSGGNNYLWSPGGFTTSTITITPSSSSTYILTVTDANGCQNTDSVNIILNQRPLVNAGADQNICNGSTVSISATGAQSYQWNPIGVTTSSILVSPSVASTYTVIGTDANGCQSSDTVSVGVNTVPVVNIPPTFVCAGNVTQLDAGNAGSTYSWSTGETTQTISISDSGTYSVIVTLPTGCATLGSAHVSTGGTISTVPVMASICSGQTVTLNAGNPNCTYNWSTGQTTPSITVSNAGNYYVNITDANGCSATLLHSVVVNPNPVASFGPNSTCTGTSISFTNSSTISSGTIQNYLWNFGDNYSSSSQNPSHLYSASGNYSVTLTVTSAAGCSNTTTNQVSSFSVPQSAFSANIVCEGSSTTFIDQSVIPNSFITSWDWNFGDGNYSAQQNPSHAYANGGSYTVTLTVSSSNSCTHSTQKTVHVNESPVASFTSVNNCQQAPIQFNNTSNPGNGTITSSFWRTGNGITSQLFSPTFTFSSAAPQTVNLIVINTAGCADTTSNTISAFPQPVASFSASSPCVNSGIQLINNSSVQSGTIQSWYWDFGDNTSSSQQTPSHTFSTAGTFNIALIVTSSNNCVDTIIQTATVHPRPVATFGTIDACLGEAAEFLNTSFITNGFINSYVWDFGDNTASALVQPVHFYMNAGTYNVELTATSNNGCTASFTSPVNVFPNPVAQFASNNVCFGSGSQFTNLTNIAGGGTFYSSWDFSDGTGSVVTNPSHLFGTAGTFNITLTVSTANGCTNQITHQSKVYHSPVTDFDGSDNCFGVLTHFTDQTFSQDGSIATWLWHFGDGTNSTESNPIHQYVSVGNYNVQLNTVSIYGCADQKNDSVEIFPVPQAVIQAANTCQGSPIQFANISSPQAGTTYMWDLGNGFTSTDSVFSYAFNSAGTYDVTIVATSIQGCSETALSHINIYPLPLVSFAANNVCESAPAVFYNHTSSPQGSVNTYTWNFGDNTTSSLSNPAHAFQSPGTYTVSLTATTNHGCTDNNTNTIIVHPTPVVNFSSVMQGCSPLHANFNESSTISVGSITSWLWNFGDGGISTDRAPDYTFTQSGTFDVTLTAVSDFGCQASLTQAGIVRVLTSPVANFIADPPVSDILNPVIQFTNQSVNYTSYQWIFSDGTTSTDLNPIHIFSDTGSYTALLVTVNTLGCVDSILKNIEIRPHSTLFIPNCFTPNGDGKNETFRPYFTQMEKIEVWVFDRWGLLLTSWDGLEGSWDGYFQGKKCQEDTYVYKIIGTGLDGKYSEWVGHVSLVY